MSFLIQNILSIKIMNKWIFSINLNEQSSHPGRHQEFQCSCCIHPGINQPFASKRIQGDTHKLLSKKEKYIRA